LCLVELEHRENPSSVYSAIGTSGGTGQPYATVLRPNGSVLARVLVFDPNFRGGVTAAVGELDGNAGTVELVAGAGAGGGPEVRVFSVNTASGAVTPLSSFFAFTPAFRGGVNVAVGRLGVTTVDNIVVAAGPGGGPHVQVLTLTPDGRVANVPGPLGSFFAYDPNFKGGVKVAVGELDGNFGDGDELATGAGPGGGPHVRVFRRNGTQFASLFAFADGFRGGVVFEGAGNDQLIADAANGTGARVRIIFNSDGSFTLTTLNFGAPGSTR
jgi:hypothetical protein